MKLKLKALAYMRYAGKPVHAGDVFDANAADVRVLLALKRAERHVELPAKRGTYKRRDAAPAQAAVMTADLAPIQPESAGATTPAGAASAGPRVEGPDILAAWRKSQA